MINQYLDATGQALGGLLDLLVRLSLPLAIGLGLAGIALALAFRREGGWMPRANGRAAAPWLGYASVLLLLIAGWAALGAVQPLARQDLQWRESAETTVNPVPDAPAVYQYGPAVAALTERTYTRTLTLPPEFAQRLGAEGIGVLSPYLTDPSSENVTKLVDTFRRSGQDVVFTRGVTRLDEEPIPLATSRVSTRFRRLAGRAYDLEFEGRYAFGNPRAEPITARFLLALPQAGTIRDLDVRVGDQPIPEPSENVGYEWKGRLLPGEKREAVVRYRVLGAGSWHYDLGSRRRRVEAFTLDAAPGGPIRFPRGSLEPTRTAGGALHWGLANVVTAQQIALSFPRDVAGRESYLQALGALPFSLLLFVAGCLLVGAFARISWPPHALPGGTAVFAAGLGSAAVLAGYLGPVAGVLLGPILGALGAAGVLGRRSLLGGVPAALLPAAFLSPSHSGLLVLLLAAATLIILARWRPLRNAATLSEASA